MSKVVFVTVGTTQFDNLVQTVTDNDIYKVGTDIQANPCISIWIYTNTKSKTIVTIEV
jgi:UDP-N-acetylglucosamine transferase subunit ALG13